MVKRAKLTLERTPIKGESADSSPDDQAAPDESEQSSASASKKNYGKFLIIAGIALVTLILFRQKII